MNSKISFNHLVCLCFTSESVDTHLFLLMALMSNDCVNNHKCNSNTNNNKGDQITNQTSSVNSMDQLLPILLYIRNFNEYDRHKPVIKRLVDLFNF